MADHAATPNSGCPSISLSTLNAEATYPATRYGGGGNHPGQGDNSSERIITSA